MINMMSAYEIRTKTFACIINFVQEQEGLGNFVSLVF